MEAVLRTARKEAEYLLKRPDVVGVGIGSFEGEPRIVISVVGLLDEPLPMRVSGVPTHTVVTGPFVALQDKDRTARWRPAPGGVSVGHKAITAGTLGCLVERDGELFILSNNHVLAASNEGVVGDEILQPGTYDGGSIPDDMIATLEDFVPVEFLLDNLPDCPVATNVAKAASWLAKRVGSKHRLRAFQDDPLATNLVDAAIARPVNPDNVLQEVLGIMTPSGHREVALGDAVVKSGRTTEVTRGVVTQIDATLQVMYGNNIAIFEQQIVTDAVCGGGDSGSIVLADDGSGNVVGLLFAGSEDGKTMIMCQIGHVLDLLGVTIIDS